MSSRFNPCYVILQAVVLFIFYVNSHATTYYVSIKGNDSNLGTTEDKPFRTIQKAADLLKAGDTVLIMQGTYGGFRIVDKHGRADAWIVFKPYPGQEVILDSYTNNYATGWGNDVRISGSSYIEINGFKMTDSNPRYDSDSFADYSQGANRDAIKIDMSGNTPPSYIRIIKNHIYRIGFGGIYSTYWSYHCEFIANYIHNVGLSKRGNGMYIGGYDHIIRGNIIHNAYGDGIHVYTEASGVASDRILIENNVFYNNGHNDYGKGYDNYGSNGIAKGDGIILYSGKNSVVRNNLVYGNYNWGIRIRNNNATVVNNTSYYNRLQGIYVYDDVSNTIIRNNISYKNQGLDGYRGEYYIGPGNIQDHNLFGIDPLFVDPEHGDFHLQAGSPAIDTGIPILGFDTDSDSTARPQGGGWDIGAYEFGGAPSLKAYLTANPTSGQAPLVVNFSGNASGGKTPYSYSWDFGDGNASAQQNPTHTYAQVNSYAAKLTVTNSDNKQSTASSTIIVQASSGTEPTVINVQFTEVEQNQELLSIIPNQWYDLYLYVDDPQGWNDISYADVWLSHESNTEGTISNRGGRYFASSNYVMSYSIADGGIWAKETEGTESWSNISGRLGLYLDDDNNEYVQNSSQKWAKARIKLLPNTMLGNWTVKAYVIDREKHISNLFAKNFRVIAADAPTASIALSDPSPTRAGQVQVILTTSNVVTKLPTPLIFTESDNSTTQIDLSGLVPGDIFTGIFVVDEAVADGIGYFALPAGALIDVNGIKGNEIKSGVFVRIDKTPPVNPQNIKVDFSPP